MDMGFSMVLSGCGSLLCDLIDSGTLGKLFTLSELQCLHL